MHPFRSSAAAAVAAWLWCSGAPAAAQDTLMLTNLDVPWRVSYFPYVTGVANDGPLVGGRFAYAQAAPYEARVTQRAALQVDAAIGFRGSRFAVAQLRAPLIADGWRFYALGIAIREARFGFYGLGNETTFDPALTENDNDLHYRVRRRGYRGWLEVTRQVVGPLHVALQGEAVSARFTAPEDEPSVFGQAIGPRLDEDDASARLALVLDTRDNEYNTQRGVLLEFGGQVAAGGDGYQRLYGILRGWLNPRPGTVLAARLAGSQLYGDPTLDSRFIIPGWERPVVVLGGQLSNRGMTWPRFAGKGVLFGNFELRQEVWSFGELGAISAIAFLDAGRVFETTKFRPTFDDLKVAGGGGIALRFLRGTIFTAQLGRGPDGTTFSTTVGWMF